MKTTQGSKRWKVTVHWTAYVLPNEPEIREYTAAVGGQIHLPAQVAATGYPNTLTADVVVEAITLRKAVTNGLARVESGVGCVADGVHAIREGSQDPQHHPQTPTPAKEQTDD